MEPWFVEMLKNTPSSKVTTVAAYEHHLEYVFRNAHHVFAFYCQPWYRKQKWYSYIQGQRAINQVSDKILKKPNEDKRETIVAFGDGKFSPSMKGHAPIAVKKLRTVLKHRCHVIDICEYNTSQKCCGCGEDLQKPKVKTKVRKKVEGKMVFVDAYKVVHGVRSCHQCSIVWNRDVNAAKNMIWKLIHSEWEVVGRFGKPKDEKHSNRQRRPISPKHISGSEITASSRDPAKVS